MSHLVGLSVGEIARETGDSPGAIKTRLSRARQALSAHLSEAPAGGRVVYLTQLTHSSCPGAPQTAAGPAGPGIFWVAAGGSLRQTTVPGVTGDASSVQGALRARLLVLARASCTGPAELPWLNVTGASQTLLSAPAGQAGVVAALPFDG